MTLAHIIIAFCGIALVGLTAVLIAVGLLNINRQLNPPEPPLW